MYEKKVDAIFVAIPAFNENYIIDTIEDALNKAENPENISFGIFNQKTPEKKFEDFSQYKNVRYINAYCDFPLGINLSRLNASLLHDDEEFYCPIDAHTWFVDSWDKNMIEDYRIIQNSGIEKPMLAQWVQFHPHSCYLDPDRKHQKHLKSVSSFPIKYSNNFNIEPDFTKEDQRNNETPLGRFIEHYAMLPGGEVLVSSDFIYEVSYDPRLTFELDIQTISLRASTRGYRMFSSGRTYMSSMGKVKYDENINETVFDEASFPDDHLFSRKDGDKRKYKKLKRFEASPSFKKIMLGEIIGWYGAPNRESYEKFRELAIDMEIIKNIVIDKKDNMSDGALWSGVWDSSNY